MPKILQKINKTVQFLIGDIDKTSLDRRLLTLLTLTFLIGNIYSLILVYSLNLSSLIKISNLCFVLFFLTFFLLVRFAKTNVNVVNVVLFAVISLFMSYYYFHDKITNYDDRLPRLTDLFFVFVFIIASYFGFKLIINSYYHERDRA